LIIAGDKERMTNANEVRNYTKCVSNLKNDEKKKVNDG